MLRELATVKYLVLIIARLLRVFVNIFKMNHNLPKLEIRLSLVPIKQQPQLVICAIFFFSMDIISPDLDSFRAAAVGVEV